MCASMHICAGGGRMFGRSMLKEDGPDSVHVGGESQGSEHVHVQGEGTTQRDQG